MTSRHLMPATDDSASTISLPGRRLGPFGSILSRVLLATACVVLTTLIVWLERGDYHDSNGSGGPLTLIQSLYYSTVTLSTTGYGDITPATEPARLVNALVITPLRFLFLITLIGTTIEVLTKRSREEFRAQRWRRHMRGHTVVVGFGVKGQSTVRGLIEAGTKASDIVVVDVSPENINTANAMGCVGIIGDATRQSTLERAKVPDAQRVVVAADRDDTAVLVTLTARRLSPTASIVTSARENNNIGVLRQSGADTVIATAESAGRMLALSLTSPSAGSVIADLLEPIDGLEIIERAVAPADLGVDPASLIKQGEVVLAVVRHGELIRFDQGKVGLLQREDRLVVVRAVGVADLTVTTR